MRDNSRTDIDDISSTLHLLLVSTIMISRIAFNFCWTRFGRSGRFARTHVKFWYFVWFVTSVLMISFSVAHAHRETCTTHKKKQLSQKCDWKYIGHVCRCEHYAVMWTKSIAKSKRPYRDPWINIAKLLKQSKWCTQDRSGFAALVDRLVANATQ